LVVKMLPIFGTAREPRKNFEDEKISLRNPLNISVFHVSLFLGLQNKSLPPFDPVQASRQSQNLAVITCTK